MHMYVCVYPICTSTSSIHIHIYIYMYTYKRKKDTEDMVEEAEKYKAKD